MTQQHLITFTVGDWSRDGHNLSEDFLVMSSAPLETLRTLHFAAMGHIGFDIGDICRKYEEAILAPEKYETLLAMGIITKDDDVIIIDEEESDDDDIVTLPLNPDDVLTLWLRILRAVGELEGTPVELTEVARDTPIPINQQLLSDVLDAARDTLPASIEEIGVHDLAHLLRALSDAAGKTGNRFVTQLTPQTQPHPPTMHFFGFDERGRHLNVPGYGVFIP